MKGERVPQDGEPLESHILSAVNINILLTSIIRL